MVKITMRGFKPVEFITSALTIKSGGNLHKEWPLLSKDVKQEGCDSVATFVQIRTREPWLTQAVVGNAYRGEMFLGVLTELREQVAATEEQLRTGLPPRSSITPDNEETDPVGEMEVMEQPETNEQTKKTQKQLRLVGSVPLDPATSKRSCRCYLGRRMPRGPFRHGSRCDPGKASAASKGPFI